MEPGSLWLLVEAAKAEIDAHRLARRSQANAQQRRKFGLQLSSRSFLPGTLGLAPATPQISSETQAEIDKIMLDLTIAMTDETNRAMIAMWLRGLADKVKEANKGHEPIVGSRAKK